MANKLFRYLKKLKSYQKSKGYMNYNDFPINHFISGQAPQGAEALMQNNATASQEKNLLPQPSAEAQLLTAEILEKLQLIVGEEKFNTYFTKNFQIQEIKPDTVVCMVSTPFLKKMLQFQYIDAISEAIENAIGHAFKVEIICPEQNSATTDESSVFHPSLNMNSEGTSVSLDENYFNRYQVQRGKSVKETSFSLGDMRTSQHSNTVQAIIQHETDRSSNPNIDQKKNFDNFVVGPSNNLAHASAVAVAKNPGLVYQSLYLYGNSGLGKTHLLHGISNYILENNPQMRVHMTTATEFMSEMIHAIQEKKVASFRKRYYEMIDVLLIDDIHELKNREGTQNEFFHIFNELQRRKKQLIFTSDKDPKEINGIEDRIKTRLSSALVIEIQQPDLETRIAILKKKAIDKDIYLPDDVVNLIASCIKNNIRELEGSLIRLGAYSSIFKVDIDLQTAREQLRISDVDQEKTINIETITKSVSQYYKIPVPDLRSKTRSKDITIARHVAMYMSYYMAKATLAEIGNYFGKRDHTSVIHAVNKIKSLQKSDQNISKCLYEIECTL